MRTNRNHQRGPVADAGSSWGPALVIPALLIAPVVLAVAVSVCGPLWPAALAVGFGLLCLWGVAATQPQAARRREDAGRLN